MLASYSAQHGKDQKMKAFGTCTPHVVEVRGYNIRLGFSLFPQSKCLYYGYGSKLSSLCFGPLSSH